MTRVAVVTCASFPDLTRDDRLLVDQLEAIGVETKVFVWDRLDVSWSTFDQVIVRSCWDYHQRPDEFAAWILAMERDGVRLWNPPRVLRWNMDKVYLRNLQQKGAGVVPTVWLDKGSVATLSGILAAQGWERAVVKPMVSASAFDTWAVSRETAVEEDTVFQRMLRRSGVLVQEFIESMSSHGEYSLMFFNKRYSHAVLRRPARGDFRSQEDFGGVAEPAAPPTALLEEADKVLRMIPEPLLYARFDAVDVGGRCC